MTKRGIFAIVSIILTASAALAQIVNPIKWEKSVKMSSATEGVISFTANIDDGWHIYSTQLPEDGPVPTSVKWENLDGVTLNGGLTPSRPAHEEIDMTFHLKLGWWENNVTFTQKFSVSTPDTYNISGYIRYMSCNNVTCQAPENVPFAFKGSAPMLSITPDSIMPDKKILATHSNVSSEQLWAPVSSEGTGAHGTSIANKSLLYIFLGGFFGGLLALLTPCVWPMIPLTVSFFLKKSSSRSRSILDAFIYGISIIVIYLILGLLITILFGASSLNALSTNAIFNIIFFLLLVVFAISFFGAFDIKLPDSWANKMDSNAERTTGILSLFFMAFTLTLVSFSCTGPIIGTLLVEAASMGDITGPIIGMAGFAIALAIPFTLFAIFPSLLKEMPKSGGWLNTVKVVLGFVELALSLKFLSIADLAYGWGILDREIFLSLWIVIFALLGAYLLGKLRFSHDSETKSIGVFSFFLAIISLSFSMYLVPGLWGAPLKGVSAFVPPLYTQDFNMNESSKFIEFDDYDAGMEFAAGADKPIFLDFSGYGCVNCRKMEAAVLDDDRIRTMLERDFVMIKLMVDNKKDLMEPEKVIENGVSTTLATYGDRWSYLQRHKFGANSQPYYVILNAKGELLAGPVYYDENIDKFMAFLEKGLANFKKQ
ncbi:MAG: cytochrome c biogenesis protein CcdA [Muribaculaceae bacterium]